MAGRHARRRDLRRRASVGSAVAVIILAIAGVALMTMESSSAPVAARVIADPARAPYGSGVHGGWEHKTPSITWDARFQEMHDTNGIMIVGDSISNATSYEFAVRMRDQHGLVTAVNNWPGRPTAPAVDWIEDHADWIPDRGIVVASGANDIFNPAKWWQQVDRVMAAADGKPVYWLSVYVDRWGTPDADQRVADMRNSAWLNDQLYSIARRHPNLVVVDWHAFLSQGYNESKIQSWLADGVHPTTAGIDGWADLLELRMGL